MLFVNFDFGREVEPIPPRPCKNMSKGLSFWRDPTRIIERTHRQSPSLRCRFQSKTEIATTLAAEPNFEPAPRFVRHMSVARRRTSTYLNLPRVENMLDAKGGAGSPLAPLAMTGGDPWRIARYAKSDHFTDAAPRHVISAYSSQIPFSAEVSVTSTMLRSTFSPYKPLYPISLKE